MSGPFGSSQWMYSSGGGFYPTTIDNSLRFVGKSAPSYLSRTFTAGSNTTWTFSWWFKPDLETNNNGTLPYFFATSGNTYIRQQSGEGYQIEGNLRGSGGTNYFFSYAPMLRDPSAWYHCVIAVDTTQGTSSNRVKFYLNGEQQTNAGGLGLSYPPLNHNTQVNTAVAHRLGAHPSAPSSYAFSGYMAEINFVDGTQLDASSFGETKSGIWIPKAYSGSYGTNGFHLEFDGNANDSSGNGNNWTANNISAHDYMPDSPTNNFNTLSSVAKSAGLTLSEGNLKTNNSNDFALGTIPVSSGKWYFEHYVNSSNGGFIGIWETEGVYSTAVDDSGNNTDGYGYYTSGQKVRNGSYQSYGSSFTTGDIVGCAFDLDNGKVYFSKNGTFQNSGNPAAGTNAAYTGLTGALVTKTGHFNSNSPTVANFGQDSTFAGYTSAGGNADDNDLGDFKYAPPSGFLAMCSANLPELAIDPANDDSPEDYFNTVLYSGTGSTQSVTGVGFQPDLLWLKQRSGGSDHVLLDAVRGVNLGLESNNADNEIDYSTAVQTSFDVDGFSVGTNSRSNNNGSTYVSWNWKAGGTAVSNTDGSITSSVSANPTAGFSIFGYTGNGVNNATIGTGLDSKAEFVIIKNRSEDSANDTWPVWHKDIGTGKYLQLNTNDAAATSAVWNDGGFTDSVISVRNWNGINKSGTTYIGYAFHNVEGYTSIGSYTGNGSSTNGPFINCGFRPAFVLIKKASAAGKWVLMDTSRGLYNVMSGTNALYPHLADAEGTDPSNRELDFLSNGFKVRNAGGDANGSGQTIVYLAFAEQPFKYANAR